jgi:prepilin-type N-terminal cleavage/methylation domain-containing protein
MFKLKKRKKGFTLVELLIVVVILGILAAIAMPRFMTTRDEAQFRSCQSNLAAINSALDEHCFIVNIPATDVDDAVLATVLANTARFPDGPPTCLKDGSAYSIDADNKRASCTNHGTIEAPIPPS